MEGVCGEGRAAFGLACIPAVLVGLQMQTACITPPAAGPSRLQAAHREMREADELAKQYWTVRALLAASASTSAALLTCAS